MNAHQGSIELPRVVWIRQIKCLMEFSPEISRKRSDTAIDSRLQVALHKGAFVPHDTPVCEADHRSLVFSCLYETHSKATNNPNGDLVNELPR
jgi:hypothetical protein